MAYQWCSYNNKVLVSPSGKSVNAYKAGPRTILFKIEDLSYDPTTMVFPSGYTYTWNHLGGGLWEFYTDKSNGWNGLFERKFNKGTAAQPNFVNYSIEYINLTGINDNASLYSMFGQTYLTSVKNITMPSSHRETWGWFSGCGRLEHVDWFDSSGATSLSSLFSGCTRLVDPPELSVNQYCMNFSGLFSNCWNLTRIPEFVRHINPTFTSGSYNRIVNASSMFSGCTGLTEIPNDFDFSKLTRTASMFANCTNITSVPTMNLEKCCITSGMFSRCTGLEDITISNIHTVDKPEAPYLSSTTERDVSRFDSMFSNCSNLKTVAITGSIKAARTTAVDDNRVDSMFANCTNMESGILSLYNILSTLKDYDGVTRVPSLHGDCFYNCGVDTITGAAELAQIPSDWK